MSLRDQLELNKRKVQRSERVGDSGVNTQDWRATQAGEAGAAREAVKRVGEYKRGRVDPSDGNNDTMNRRSVEKL